MDPLTSEAAQQFMRAVGPQPDEILTEMDDIAQSSGFPHVGPDAGGWLMMLANLIDARRVFEFGSGFGYSAYWFARAIPSDGEIVLTELDEGELDMAEEFLTRGGFTDRTTLEHGDALETIERYAGPFDIALIDARKDLYREAFHAVREKIGPGGLIIADNAMTMTGSDSFRVRLDVLNALLAGDDPSDVNRNTRSIAQYLSAVGQATEFETVVLPVGKGMAISRKTT